MSATEAAALAALVDAALAAQPGVVHLYAAQPLGHRAVRAVSAADDVRTWVQPGDPLTITASVGVSSAAGGAAFASRLAEVVRRVPGAERAAVRIRVSRIVPEEESADPPAGF